MKKQNRKRRAKSTRSKPARHTQLNVPSNPQSAPTLFTHTLIWIGSTLSAFTFLGALQTVIDFSPWASWILKTWLTAAEDFWRTVFELFGLTFVRDGVVPLTFILTMLVAGFGAMTLELRQARHQEKKRQPSLWNIVLDPEINLRRIEGFAIGLTISLATVSVVKWHIFASALYSNDFVFGWTSWVVLALSPALYLLIFFMRSWRDYLHLLLLTASMTTLYVVMLIPAAASAKARGNEELWHFALTVANISVFLFPSKMLAIMTFARARFWNYRLLYIWLTIGLILLLDWAARNSITLRPPS